MSASLPMEGAALALPARTALVSGERSGPELPPSSEENNTKTTQSVLCVAICWPQSQCRTEGLIRHVPIEAGGGVAEPAGCVPLQRPSCLWQRERGQQAMDCLIRTVPRCGLGGALICLAKLLELGPQGIIGQKLWGQKRQGRDKAPPNPLGKDLRLGSAQRLEHPTGQPGSPLPRGRFSSSQQRTPRVKVTAHPRTGPATPVSGH